MLASAFLLLGATIVGCGQRGGYCKRGGIIVPCACGYTYPHFAAPSFGPPGPYGGAPDPYYSGQPQMQGGPARTAPAGSSAGPGLTPVPAPAPNLNGTPPVGTGTR